MGFGRQAALPIVAAALFGGALVACSPTSSDGSDPSIKPCSDLMSHLDVAQQVMQWQSITVAQERTAHELPSSQWTGLKEDTVLARCAYQLVSGPLPTPRACPSGQTFAIATGASTRAYLVAPDKRSYLVPSDQPPALDDQICVSVAA